MNVQTHQSQKGSIHNTTNVNPVNVPQPIIVSAI